MTDFTAGFITASVFWPIAVLIAYTTWTALRAMPNLLTAAAPDLSDPLERDIALAIRQGVEG